MEFGLFSNGHRHGRVAAYAYEEDLFEVVTADRLGFREAWLSEHIGLNRPDTLPAPELFICKAAALTKRIMLGPAVRLLPLYNPIDVATTAAVCDHLTGGRYMFGFGGGGLGLGNMEQRGMTDDLRHPMMLESIELILRCWSEHEPFAHEGEFWQGKWINVQPKPLQKPHMPLAVATNDDTFIRMAAERGYLLLMSHYDPPSLLREKMERYVLAQTAAGRRPERAPLRVCRQVYVAPTDKQAREEARAGMTVDIEEQKIGRPALYRRYIPEGGTIDDVTYDYLVEQGMIILGSPDTVCERIKALYDETGGFGALLLTAGRDWSTREKRARSMRLLRDAVAPYLADLDPDSRGGYAVGF